MYFCDADSLTSGHFVHSAVKVSHFYNTFQGEINLHLSVFEQFEVF